MVSPTIFDHIIIFYGDDVSGDDAYGDGGGAVEQAQLLPHVMMSLLPGQVRLTPLKIAG